MSSSTPSSPLARVALAASALLAMNAAPRAGDPSDAPFLARPNAVSCFVSSVESAELQRILVGDVNGDAYVDFLSFAQMTDDIFPPNDRVCVMLGQPDGRFASAGSVSGVPTMARRYAADLGDLTGDGHADLLLATRENGAPSTHLQLFTGDGAGGFTKQPAGVLVTQNVQGPDKRLALRDTDGDGDLDALLSGNDDVALYENLGGGSFAPGVTLLAPGALTTTVVADLSGDGRDDVVCASLVSGSVRAVLASPSGGFEAPVITPGAQVTALPFELGDVDGDHVPDVLFGPTEAGPARYLPGDGLGGFGTPVAIPTIPLNDGETEHRLREIVDIDGDGLPDIVAQQYQILTLGGLVGGALVVVPGLGGGSFGAPEVLLDAGGLLDAVVFPSSNLGHHNTPEFLDLDGDGDLDHLALTDDASGVAVYRADADGRFGGLARAGGSETLPPLVESYPVDLDLDGDLDLLRQHSFATLSTVENLGDGSFGAPVEHATGIAGTSPRILVGHVDLDARSDVVVLSQSGDDTLVRVLFGQAGGGLSAPTSTQLLKDFDLTRSGDFDGDGRLDLVTRTASGPPFFSRSFSVWRGLGNGSFSVGDRHETDTPVLDLVPGDLDGDGTADLIVRENAVERVWLNLGDGTLADAGVALTGPLGTTQLADLDGDGTLDRFTDLSGNVYAQSGNGDGTFGSLSEVLDESASGGGVFAADLTGDGILDLVSRSGRFVAPGDGALGFDAPFEFTWQEPSGPAGFPLSAARAGDLDGDGQLDLLLRDLLYDPVRTVIGFNLLGDPWKGRGHALAGGFGTPRLRGLGTLEAGSSVTLALSDARPGAASFLVVGLSEIALPFKGGTFVPAPTRILPAQLTSAEGTAQRVLPVLQGFSGLQLWWQSWIVDPAGPAGYAASNGLMSTLP